MSGMAGLRVCAIAHRVFLPALRAGAGRILPDATADCASVSHANNSTIGSNFCQVPGLKKMRAGGGGSDGVMEDGGAHMRLFCNCLIPRPLLRNASK
jgi:hypothetical protein